MTENTTVHQPPPRKVKLLHELRSVRAEQLSKLHAKHQAETELLEDIKEFAKARVAIERTYASCLYKLSCQYLQKREFPPAPSEALEDTSEHRTIHQVWKSLLEETSRVAQSRLASSEVVSGQVSDSIKLQKSMRTQTLKKCEELCKAWDEEIQYSVRELARAKKNYSEAEKAAQDARAKFNEANERLKKGSLKLFQSKNTLGKNCTRLNAKKSVCDKRSAHLRNDYLFHLSAANAHQNRLFNVDLPHIMETLDADFHTRLRKYFMTFCTAEIEACTFAKMCSEKVLHSSEKVKREFHRDTFLKANPVFTNTLHYVYDPVPSDEVNGLIIDETENLYLEREARKWATEVAKMSKLAENVSKQMTDCQNNTNQQLKGSDNSSDSGFSQDKDPDVNFDNLREYLRKVETTKLKAEAKLEVLRDGGIQVDEWIESAFEAIAKEAELEAQVNPPNTSTAEEKGGSTSFDDTAETLNVTYHDIDRTMNEAEPMTRAEPLHCTSLYCYEAQREDELTIGEGESLQIIEESEGDGWIKVQNVDGQCGYIPEAYVEVQRVRGFSVSDGPSANQDAAVSPQISQGSANSLTDYEVQAVTANMVSVPDSGTPAVCYVRALYDYTGSSSEELSFLEGTVFKVTSKGEPGVDDGYWEGELAGHIGVFPSLLVEEVDENGSVLGSEEDVEEEDIPSPDFDPPDFAPPDFAPPPLPEISFTQGDEGTLDGYYSFAENDYLQPRSAPQSPMSESLKPARSAPPPPSAKNLRNSWGQFENAEINEESLV